MKPNQQPDAGKNLQAALRQWTVDAPLPPRFQDRVWQRIQRAEAQPAGGLWRNLLSSLETMLPRPRVALSYVATLVILGVAAGFVAGQVQSGHLNSTLSQRYVQSVDPYHGEVARP